MPRFRPLEKKSLVHSFFVGFLILFLRCVLKRCLGGWFFQWIIRVQFPSHCPHQQRVPSINKINLILQNEFIWNVICAKNPP
jgi:hypothetical protein